MQHWFLEIQHAFVFDVAIQSICNANKIKHSLSTVKSILGFVITLIYYRNSHMDKSIQINISFCNNQIIQLTHFHSQSLFALVIPIFFIFIRLNDGWYNYIQSYYNTICWYAEILTTITLLLLWINIFTWIVSELVLFGQKCGIIISVRCPNDCNSAIHRKIAPYDGYVSIICHLQGMIHVVYSLETMHQLIYCLSISKIFIADPFLIIVVVLIGNATKMRPRMTSFFIFYRFIDYISYALFRHNLGFEFAAINARFMRHIVKLCYLQQFQWIVATRTRWRLVCTYSLVCIDVRFLKRTMNVYYLSQVM